MRDLPARPGRSRLRAVRAADLLLQGILGTQRLDARDLVLVTPCMQQRIDGGEERLVHS